MKLPRKQLERVEVGVRLVCWAALGVALGAVLLGHNDISPEVLLPITSLFFGLIVVELVLAMVLSTQRRKPLFALLVALILWATGSSLVSATAEPGAMSFPSPSETFFLASYLALAAFLVLDAQSRLVRSVNSWLDAAIVCGGMASIAGVFLMSPLGHSVPDNIPVIVALLFPILDIALLMLVVAQALLGARAWTWRTAALILSFIALLIADSTLVTNVEDNAYDFPVILDVLWGLWAMLLIEVGVRPTKQRARADLSLHWSLVVFSFAGAVILLAFRPDGATGQALAVTATITTLAAGARLVTALRDSQATTDAFRLALTDDLTDLPNRRAVKQIVDSSIAKRGKLGLMMLDLDGFKDVNDTLGHTAGDQLLIEAAWRMRNAVSSTCTVARMGGDEFAIISPSSDALELLETANLIHEALMDVVHVDGVDLTLSASVGITLQEATDANAIDLFRRADIAMYQAKLVRSTTEFYDSEKDEFSRQRLRMGEELRRSLREHQLEVWYQPKVDVLTWENMGVEALIRWRHPEHGLLAPQAFLGVARRAGLMADLTTYIFRQCLADYEDWRSQGINLGIAINIAPQEMLSRRILPEMYAILEDSNVPPDAITLEVTEESFMADPDRAHAVITEAHFRGLRISIDDFGTGFSSLSYLRDLPIHEIKLDRSLVVPCLTDQRSRLIVESTISMAHALGLKVVAEGVENAQSAALMASMGADLLQGFHYSPALAQEHVASWLMTTSLQPG